MNTLDIVQQRLAQQQIARQGFNQPGDVVAWLGAVQAQDYRAALWAVGLRLPTATEATIEQALADKTIVRTWPMRGTLHLVAAADLRWLLALTAPRLRMLVNNVLRYQKLDLDEETFAKTNTLLLKALQGGKQLTRPELTAVLGQAGIEAAGLRLTLILQRAVADSVICFGERRGSQATFALLDEWVPASRALTREESLAELTRRYFSSHGPATLADFVWWSGLTTTEAKVGLALVQSYLGHETIGKQTYWFGQSSPQGSATELRGYLLPAFDEYVVSYKDRSATLNPLYTPQVITTNGIFNPSLVIDGQIVGTWKRDLKKSSVVIKLKPFTALGEAEMVTLNAAAANYGRFVNKAVEVVQEREV